MRAARNEKVLNKHARPLSPFKLGDRVFVQNQSGQHPTKWDKLGTVVEILNFDQYTVKMDGSGRVTKRNRRFLRPVPQEPSSTSLPFLPNNVDQPTASHDDNHDDSPMPAPIDTPETFDSLPRRSSRERRPALELEPESGRWIPRGTISSMTLPKVEHGGDVQ